MVKKKGGFLLVALVLVCALAGWTVAGAAPAYARAENWAYRETEKTAAADVFFICPTVYSGYNMPMDDAEAREDFVGATNMEKGIYDGDSRFFAPYYRQAGLSVYDLPAAEREPYLALAYEDVKDAFLYYLEHYNEGRPIIVAGFSQGATDSTSITGPLPW